LFSSWIIWPRNISSMITAIRKIAMRAMYRMSSALLVLLMSWVNAWGI